MSASIRHIGSPLGSRGGIRSVSGGGGAAADSAAYTNFIARTALTSPTDDTYINAYKAMLNGLTTDGLFNSDGTTNYFDFLYIFATKNSATSLLNLPNNTYAAVAQDVGSTPGGTFTANSGWADDGTTNIYVDTGFNPTTAGSPKYVQNSAHMSVWNLTNISSVGKCLIGVRAGSNSGQNVFPNVAGDLYTRVNDSPEAGGITVADNRGHILGNRSTSTARQSYQNGSDLGSLGSVSSQAPINANIIGLSGTGLNGASIACTIAMLSGGASMNATQVGNFYTRLRTYMTAVGVP